jgi:hypothetical protein
VIVSHEHEFIFMKTTKTAGTSVEVFLSRIAGEDAIVTPLAPPEQGHLPRNFTGSRFYNPLPALFADPDGVGPLIRHPRRRVGLYRHYWNHNPAWLARAKLGKKAWDRYFKFCFERNPWDKAVSRYWWSVQGMSDRPTLSEFVLAGHPRLKSDWPVYAIGEEVAVDAVGRYEHLQDDLRSILGSRGLTVDVDLPRAKANHRRRDEAVRFSPQSAERIGDLFHREVVAFGYECPDFLAPQAATEKG